MVRVLLVPIALVPAAYIPTHVVTVDGFHSFLDQPLEKDLDVTDHQVNLLYDDYLVSMGRMNMDGSVVHSVLEEDRKHYIGAFRSSLKRVLALNEIEQHKGDGRAYFGVNHFADWTPDEFAVGRLNSIGSFQGNSTFAASSQPETVMESVQSTAPQPVQFSSQCQLTTTNDVRHQGQCGSCWAFGTAESLRYQYQKKYGQDPGPLSAQFLVDCVPQYQNRQCGSGAVHSGGCCGGSMMAAVDFMIQAGGIPTVADYGEYHNGGGNACRHNVRKAVQPGPGFQTTDESEMYNMYCAKGPFVIHVAADHLLHYTGGMLDSSSCPATQTDHITIVVGAIKYHGRWAWVMQNSWGADWGATEYGARNNGRNGGFALLKYGDNVCNMARGSNGATFASDIFSAPGGPHRWHHTAPLMDWDKTWGPYPGVTVNPGTNLGTQRSLQRCEAAAEARGLRVVAYSDDGSCYGNDGNYRSSWTSRSSSRGALYKIGSRPVAAAELPEEDEQTNSIAILGIVGAASISLAGIALLRRRKVDSGDSAYTSLISDSESKTGMLA